MYLYEATNAEFGELVGKTFVKVEVNEQKDKIIFVTDEGETFKLYHYQDCCESVHVESITGDLDDLLNTPILLAEERTSRENPDDVKPENQDSFTWTFYTLRTIKGSVDIRWYGESNGYYSESVDFRKMPV